MLLIVLHVRFELLKFGQFITQLNFNSRCREQRVELNLVHDRMSTHGLKQEYSGKCVYLFIVLRELHLMESPDTEAIFSVLCSSDILEQHNKFKRM